MGLPNPSALVKKQTEAVSLQFDSKKNEVYSQIQQASESQISQVEQSGEDQMAQIDGKLNELGSIRDQIGETDPRVVEVNRQIGMLKEQKKQIKAQIKMAISQVKVNGARERLNIKTRLEREKQKAITQAVGAALAQYSMMMQQMRAKKEGAVNDELKAGNRG